ncbi:extracellular solute-binding protein [Methylocapsa palsarum]|uniref:Microcin C transport system substrate-binding protein n=1 Tax=Methylocapsa palsarum TaxID=1612308 RepID=A0A1I4DFR3_9HYPH|nr:extracellular solute-binding protein [Methylocapsa palsarum]SFK90946.1 microcin C transport system substrate-binding protein [Methylocapsa palsarum]
MCGRASAAAEELKVYGLSVFGDLAEAPDFKAFGYVNVAAPKGGALSRDKLGTFNSLNAFILRGDPAFGLEFVFDSLLKGSLDEHDALYGLVARAVRISPDKRTYRFLLRKEARFHDGAALTAKDAAFSLEMLKSKGHPTFRLQLRDLISATPEADDNLVVRFEAGRSRQLPLFVAGCPIFSSSYYGKIPFDETTLEPPLGSGPYRVGRFEQGRFIAFDRVEDYWAKDLPVNVGQANFDTIRFDYYSDRAVAFEGFKAGAFAVHEESKASTWARGYDFPAMRDGRVKRETIPDENLSGVQGWFLNVRRPALQDRRIREAIGNAFDFAWTNKNLMFDAYERTTSYFQNSELAASGLPDAAELALLEPFRDKLPSEVFSQPYLPPEADGSGQDRILLRRAYALLLEAGCKREGAKLMLPDGRSFELEFLSAESGLLPHTQTFVANLKQLGVNARIRLVDAAQYKLRLDNFDFDVVSARILMFYSPGEELRDLFGSEAARTHGSRNIAGIADPTVDALIAKAVAANTRVELVHVCRALDRVLRAGRYWVPHWYKPSHWIAHWDIFGRPERPPRYNPGIEFTWWYDEEKAKRINFFGR